MGYSPRVTKGFIRYCRKYQPQALGFSTDEGYTLERARAASSRLYKEFAFTVEQQQVLWDAIPDSLSPRDVLTVVTKTHTRMIQGASFDDAIEALRQDIAEWRSNDVANG